jgi:NitT/TauT family transport system ATP-binding protein
VVIGETVPQPRAASTRRDYVVVEEVGFSYGNRDEIALEGASFSAAEGEFACLLGPSGCGKSTLLTILSGLAKPSRGRVTVDDKELYGPESELSRPRCGYVFQDGRLLPWRTVKQNITVALQAAGTPKERWDEIVSDSLRMLRLEQYVDAWPMQLSGGQRQRVAIARALAVDPSYILMDEPFSTLDEVTARFLRRELLSIWERTGRTIIFVTHSLREAVYLADRVFIMTSGPGRIYDTLEVDVSRPRDYEDPRLTVIERDLASSVLELWGYYDNAETS